MEGLPVVDDDGFIVDVISCRDIQIMNRSLSRLECLWDKISSYKSTVRNVMGSDKDTGSSGSAVRQRER